MQEQTAFPTQGHAAVGGGSGPVQGDLQTSEANAGSVYRSGFGEELPAAVYESIFLGFASMLAVAWLAFGGAVSTDLDLVVVTVLCGIFLLLPILMHRAASARAEMQHPDLKRFLSVPFETATGPLTGRAAWLEIALIPLALASAALLIGSVYVWMA